MTIHKPTLLKMLKDFIVENYKENDIDILLYLVEKIILHHPENNCIKKGDWRLWDDIPANKSLFTCDKNCGMPIGNLTSQCFANFYMHYFDIYMRDTYKYYGRYVDDFYIISKNKYAITKSVDKISNDLYSNLNVTLHKDKLYIQHYSKGVKFTGAVVKKSRIYMANRSIGTLYNKLYTFNRNPCQEMSVPFIQSLNSYFGFLKHYCSYNIKKKIVNRISKEWFKYLELK